MIIQLWWGHLGPDSHLLLVMFRRLSICLQEKYMFRPSFSIGNENSKRWSSFKPFLPLKACLFFGCVIFGFVEKILSVTGKSLFCITLVYAWYAFGREILACFESLQKFSLWIHELFLHISPSARRSETTTTSLERKAAPALGRRFSLAITLPFVMLCSKAGQWFFGFSCSSTSVSIVPIALPSSATTFVRTDLFSPNSWGIKMPHSTSPFPGGPFEWFHLAIDCFSCWLKENSDL